MSNSVYLTACFFFSSSDVICARAKRCARSSKNHGNSRGREVSNLGAARSLRIGIGMGVVIAVTDGIKLTGNGELSGTE